MEYHEQLFLYIWPISETNSSKDKYYHSSLKEEVHNLIALYMLKRLNLLLKTFQQRNLQTWITLLVCSIKWRNSTNSIQTVLENKRERSTSLVTRKWGCGEWGSTFLMNTDTKILSKILVNLIQQQVKRITHHDQVECILGIQERVSIQILINVIKHINRLKKKNIRPT